MYLSQLVHALDEETKRVCLSMKWKLSHREKEKNKKLKKLITGRYWSSDLIERLQVLFIFFSITSQQQGIISEKQIYQS
jgi:hypothetical protein